MIRVDALWLAAAPIDMRSGFDSVLARVVAVFGAAAPHTAYVFINQRSTRIKVLVHDGLGLWLAARRLHQGGFEWLKSERVHTPCITREQFDALVLGLPWTRIAQAIDVV